MADGETRQQSRIAWHPGMVSALKLELYDNKEDLEYQEEYLLNKEPVRIDLLVLKKRPGVKLRSSLASHFRTYNIIEMKSPDDQLNIDTVCNTLSYAYKYKAMGENVDCIPIEEITITMVRKRKPQRLFQYVEQHGGKVQALEDGLWCLQCNWGFPIYVIVLNQVSEQLHLWLSVLGRDLTTASLQQIFTACKSYVELDRKRLVDSAMSVLMQSNEALFIELKGVDGMCKEFLELFKPEIDSMLAERTATVTKSVAFSTTLQMLRTAMRKNQQTPQEAMDFFEIPAAEQAEYLAALR